MANLQWLMLLDALSLLCIGFMAAAGLFYLGDLPPRIPTHFGADGLPDQYGDKGIILGLPALAMGISVVVKLIGNNPNHFNFPVKVTDENRPALIFQAQLLISAILLSTNALIAYLHWELLQVGLGRQQTIGTGIVWLFAGFIVLFSVNSYLRMKRLG